MPTYQYACTACDDRLEVVQSFTDAALTECPACKGALRKVFSAVGVVFKGSGFYKNDSRKTASDSAPKTDGGKSDGKGDSGKGGESTTKTEPKSDAKPAATKSESGAAKTSTSSTPASKTA